MFWTSKLSTCYIDGVTLGMKIQSIAYLLEGGGGDEYIYILNFGHEAKVHSIWVSWTSSL